MKDYIVHLIPRSSYEIALHSDTLFGAICWGIRTLFGEEMLVQVLDEFNASPAFLISSAFPYKHVGNQHKYFLPMPVLKPLTIAELSDAKFTQKAAKRKKETYHSDKFYTIEIADNYKKFKKIKYIGLPNFKKAVKKADETHLFTDYLDGILNEPKFCRDLIAQKNSIDRLTNSTAGSGNTFYVPEIAYRENFGLYFLLKVQNINKYLKPVLLYLEDTGIGPNARTGKNRFKVAVVEKSLFDANNGKQGDSFITLSRYIKNEPIDVENSFYQITSVRSKVESRFEFAGEDIWKHRVSYLAAGSVISPKNDATHYGRLVPAKAIGRKTIYQYGYAYPVWINSGGTNEI